MKKVLVLTSDWGHLSIAKAVMNRVNRKYLAKMCYIEAEPISKAIGDFIYKYIPRHSAPIFKMTYFPAVQKLLYFVARKYFGKKIENEIGTFKPDVIINTYWGFNPTIEKLTDLFQFKYFNVLSDPWTFSSAIISKKAINLAFDEKSMSYLNKYEPEAKGVKTGWFTENKFYQSQKYKREIFRKKLKIDPQLFTICIVTGSEGTFNVLKIIQALISPKYHFQVIILCGNNKGLLRSVNALRMVTEKTGGPKIVAIPFTNSVHEYMRASNLVIGKAGPNTLFESVATLTPFFAISHFSGQEYGNLEIINHYKIGFVEENPSRATKLLKEIVINPNILDNFEQPLKKLSDYCYKSEGKLKSLLV